MMNGMHKYEMIEAISLRDGYFCFICKEPFGKREKPTIDHWIPLSRGGTWVLSNLRLAHKSCNIWKSDRLPNPDGTIPEKPERSRSKRKKERPALCGTCHAGRGLNMNQICPDCGSFPQPRTFPMWAKKRPYECDHNINHCFSCIIGLVERSCM